MKDNKRKLASFVVASTILTTGAISAHADDTIYVIQDGDTLRSIAMEYYGDSSYYNDIAKYNGITNPDFIVTGNQIKLPEDFNSIEIEEKNDMVYTVQDGDTLGRIAEEYYGNSDYYVEIAKYNGMANPNVLNIGDQIILPATLTVNNTIIDVANYEEDAVYVVQSGDVLSCICRVYYGKNDVDTAWKLATYNNLANPDKIYVGQELKLPVYEKLSKITAIDYSYIWEPAPLVPAHKPFHHHFEPHHKWHHDVKVKKYIP